MIKIFVKFSILTYKNQIKIILKFINNLKFRDVGFLTKEKLNQFVYFLNYLCSLITTIFRNKIKIYEFKFFDKFTTRSKCRKKIVLKVKLK